MSTTTARKAGICCNCNEPFAAGDPIRFTRETRTVHLDANSWSRAWNKPRHAHACHNAAMVAAYLASVEERRESLRQQAAFMRETIGADAFEARRSRFEEYQRPKFEALDAEEAHIREHGHPYPEEVAAKAAARLSA
jgi:hypothetical protein